MVARRQALALVIDAADLVHLTTIARFRAEAAKPVEPAPESERPRNCAAPATQNPLKVGLT